MRLTRATHGRPASPVRIVHLGIGNFARAHQAWYTEHAPDAAEWGIAAFTGRRPDAAGQLAPQDGLYTLITQGPDGDSYEVISSLSAVHPASDHEALLGYFESPDLAIVTTTVTEAGYMRAPDGSLDTARVAADIDALRTDPRAVVVSTPMKVVAGLLARRAGGSGALTILPCDNLPENGSAFARVIRDAAVAVDATLVEWIDSHVAWGTCMVDRITPATTDAHREAVERSQGYEDVTPVPTEPFSEWVISGEFPAGRPAWDAAGAQIVEDVTPFEERKLWMLNGAHSTMAYSASIRGYESVSEAMGDEEVRQWLAEWWDAAGSHLSIESAEYRQALVERFANPSIRHLLAQIAYDGSQKLPVRILPTLRAEAAAGSISDGALRPVGAWSRHIMGEGAPIHDAGENEVRTLVAADLEGTVRNVLAWLDPALATDDNVTRTVTLARAI